MNTTSFNAALALNNVSSAIRGGWRSGTRSLINKLDNRSFADKVVDATVASGRSLIAGDLIGGAPVIVMAGISGVTIYKTAVALHKQRRWSKLRATLCGAKLSHPGFSGRKVSGIYGPITVEIAKTKTTGFLVAVHGRSGTAYAVLDESMLAEVEVSGSNPNALADMAKATQAVFNGAQLHLCRLPEQVVAIRVIGDMAATLANQAVDIDNLTADVNELQTSYNAVNDLLLAQQVRVAELKVEVTTGTSRNLTLRDRVLALKEIIEKLKDTVTEARIAANENARVAGALDAEYRVLEVYVAATMFAVRDITNAAEAQEVAARIEQLLDATEAVNVKAFAA